MQSNIRVVNQDATLLFKEIPDNSIDLIVTDPPYPVIGGGSNVNDDVGRPRGILKKNDGKIFKHNDLHISSWIHQCYRVLKDKTHLYIMINFLNIEEYMREIRNAGFDIHSMFMPFNDIINDHLRKEKKRILEKLNELAKIHSKSLKITLNIYNIVMLINYPKLKAELSERFDKLN